MSNAYDEFEFETPEEKPVSEGGTLRKKLEAAIELLKAKDTQIAELNKYRTESEVNSLLKDIPERFHKLARTQLAENPTSEGLNAFVADYGDLWGAEVEEPNAEEAGLRQALEKINNATREARNIKEEPFKMPSPDQLARMPISEVNKLMEQAKANYKV
jgi:hypothetical protein